MKTFIRNTAVAGMTAMASLFSASCSNSSQISGTLSGVGDGSLVVTVFGKDVQKPALQDTIELKNGKFAVDFEDTALFIVNFQALSPAGDVVASSQEPLVFLPGDKIKVEGSVKDPEFSGSAIYDGLAAYEEYNELGARFDSLYTKSTTARQDEMSELQASYEALVKTKDETYLQYIKEHPQDIVSGYLTMFLSPETGVEADKALDSSVKEGPLGELIDEIVEGYENSIIREQNENKVKPGKPAPDFSLPDINGKTVSLKDFRGKYVLVDFWGSWCYWCMKGMPQMKEYYNKYKNRIEFVGINCADSEKTWKATVAKEELNWTNLFNGNGHAVTNSYAVSGFPTKVLIDKEGNIVQVYVGESDELYQKLDELF